MQASIAWRTLAAAALLATLVLSSEAADSWRAHVSTDLGRIYDATSRPTSDVQSVTPVRSLSGRAKFDASHRVQIDIKYDCGSHGVPGQAKNAGLVTGASVAVKHICIVEGFAPISALPALASIPGVLKVKLPAYPAPRPKPTEGKSPASLNEKSSPLPTGAARRALPQGGGSPMIDGSGVTIMRADQFITQTGVNGAGVSVAVMSGDVASLSVIQGRGELPAVEVITPTGGGTPSPSPTDEGTMMLEEVYAVAPGATLLFCGPGTSIEYVSCLQNLTAAGASIVVDDLAYPGEDLMSADGDFAVMVQAVLAADPFVALFTVTENYNGSYWQGAYSPVTLASYGSGPQFCSASGQLDYYVQSFNGASYETLTVYAAGTYNVTFQWADPFDQNVSNFDVYWYDVSTGTQGCFSAAGSPETLLTGPLTFDAGTYALFVMTPDASLSGKYLKLFIGGDGSTALNDSTSGSIISPQAFVSGVNTVGAVIGSDGVGNTIESYSGLGPIQFIFPNPTQIQAPLFVAPDAIYVDAQGTDFLPELGPDGLFHGTSAASPNAASVAALIRSAFPNATPVQLSNALEQGATALAASPPDGTFGYGRVDALGALSTIPVPSLSSWPNGSVVGGSSTPSTPLTVGGFGSIRFSVQSSNPSLFPATLVPLGTAGVTLAPANCGIGVACMISAKPLAGQIGSATITLIATDGANRTATTATTVTVTVPPAPTVSVTGGASQTVNANSAIAPIAFSVAGTGPLTIVPSTSTGGNVTISTGCGTSTLSCTAQVASVATVGPVMVTLTVQDGYGQSSSSTATVTVKAPAAPTIAIVSGGTQTVNVSTPIAPVTFTLTGTAPLTVMPNTNGIAAATLSSGCGTTTMSCTANLGTALTTAGTATLELIVNDNYGQTVHATATIMEVSPPASHGGGGALSFLSLLPLIGLTMIRVLSVGGARKGLLPRRLV